MITITPAAAHQILIAAEQAGMEEPLLRIAARYDDDTDELEIGMGFDDRREQDEEIRSEGVILLVSPPSRESLEGTVLDYVETAPDEFRFVFGRDPQHED